MDDRVSFVPSGYFGGDIEHIQHRPEIMTEEERMTILSYAQLNDIWDKDQEEPFKDRVALPHTINNQEIVGFMSMVLSRVKSEIEAHFHVEVSPTSPAITKWSIGDWHEVHADKEYLDGTPNDRNYNDIASVIYLNDDYTGGEIHFPDHGLSIKPEKRSAYFFPGDLNYKHGVKEITSGSRYTIPAFWTITKLL